MEPEATTLVSVGLMDALVFQAPESDFLSVATNALIFEVTRIAGPLAPKGGTSLVMNVSFPLFFDQQGRLFRLPVSLDPDSSPIG